MTEEKRYASDHPAVRMMLAIKHGLAASADLTGPVPDEVTASLEMLHATVLSLQTNDKDELPKEILGSMLDQTLADVRVVMAHAEGRRLTRALLGSKA